MPDAISPLPPTQGEERAREVLAAIRTKHAESAVMYSGEDSVIAAMLAFAAERTVSTPAQGKVEAGDAATSAAFHAIYGPGADPFLNPPGWEWAEKIAKDVAASLTPSAAVQTAPVVQNSAEVDRLMHVIDRDRYVVAACVGEIERQIRSREWLTQGRGPYEWDDDRFYEEFADAIGAIRDAVKPLAIVGWDKSDCTRIEARVNAARLAARDLLAKPIGPRDMVHADIFADPRDAEIERLKALLSTPRPVEVSPDVDAAARAALMSSVQHVETLTSPRPVEEAGQTGEVPIPMVLFCPSCHTQHIDEPDERTPEWDNPPHRSHLCHQCGCIWRPADVATEGVAAITTVGKADTWKPTRPVEGGDA